MADHLLITYATRRPYRAVSSLSEDAVYDPERGYWINGDAPLVAVEKLGNTTKKCDQETGEDQKGE